MKEVWFLLEMRRGYGLSGYGDKKAPAKGLEPSTINLKG